MSRSFKNRLERLHGSRKRAEQRAEEEKEDQGVFSSEDVAERDHPPGEAPSEGATKAGAGDESVSGDGDDDEETSDNESPSSDPFPEMTVRRADAPGADDEKAAGSEAETPDTEVGERLARSYSLRDRGDRGRSSEGSDSGSGGSPNVSHETTGAEGGDEPSLPPNERAEMLRKRAAERIGDGDWEGALPVLHEIVALLPRHAFALEKLAKYHRERGDGRLAEHYESRLRDVTPF